METVRNLLHRDDTEILLLLTLTILVTLLLVGGLILALRQRRLTRRLGALMHGMADRNIEEVLAAHLDRVDETQRRMDVLEQAVAVLQAQLPSTLQRVNLVRYDAFEDVGGEQSFSLALLDAHGDGIVLTSVYSRMEVRVYAKAIRNGRASHALSTEEERVLRECGAHR